MINQVKSVNLHQFREVIVKSDFIFLLAIILVAGCLGERSENFEGELTDIKAPDSSDTITDTGYRTPIETAICGLSKYEWIEPDKLGIVTRIEELPEYSLSKEAIKSLLKDYAGADFIEIKYDVRVLRFRYKTQNKGVETEATSTFGVPVPPEGEEIKSPAVLWLHGTTGFMDNCAPGRTEEGAYPMVLMATQGMIAVGPDYIGLSSFGEPSTVKHPYLGIEATAIASLDALKGGISLIKRLKLPVTFDNRVILWGGSQGGHAVFASELMAPYYAPQYNFIAAIALIPPTNLIDAAREALLRFGNDTVTLAAVMIELSRWYEIFNRMSYVIRNDEPSKPLDTLTNLMDTRCGTGDSQYKIDSPDDLYTEEFIENVTNNNWKDFEDIKCILRENSPDFTYIKRKSDTPFLFVLSENDELVNTPVERQSFTRLCNMGYKMKYLECAGASHTQGAAWSVKEQFEWLKDRLNNVGMTGVCQINEPVRCSGTK